MSDDLFHIDADAFRIYPRGGRHPTRWNQLRSFGPISSARFDHHLQPSALQDRGVLYASLATPSIDALTTAVGEVFQDTRVIDGTTGDPWLASWHLRGAALLDLSSTWTVRAGGNQALCSGDRAVARSWSRSIYDAFEDLYGMTWHSSITGTGRCIVLFDRAADLLAGHPLLHTPLDNPALRPALTRSARMLGYLLA